MVFFVMLDTETTTRKCTGVAVPGNYQKCYEKYPLSISLIKVAFFMDSFCNHFEIF